MSSSLGKSIQNSKQRTQRSGRKAYKKLLDEEAAAAQAVLAAEEMQQRPKNNKLKSIWETNDLENFLSIADEREEGYFAERDVRVVVGGKVLVVQNNLVVPENEGHVTKDWLKLNEMLTIPKRPSWDYKTTAEELQDMEKQSFTDWRRQLAKLEEENKVLMTPYEKNLEVWRQLWRVAERSHIVVLILDARNPLIFRNKDFEKYVQSMKTAEGVPKKVVLLLNKADLLTEAQRKEWSNYFTANGDLFFFFSAKPLEPEPMDLDDEEGGEGEEGATAKAAPAAPEPRKSRHKKKTLRAPVEVSNAYELAEQRKALKNKIGEPKAKPVKPHTQEEIERDKRVTETAAPLVPSSVLDPIQLLDQFALLRHEMAITDENTPIMVGFVGFPNVGKSSTINSIMGAKKVLVSATPGKTKHFQTLVIPNERRVALCDCPGLVFPSFASTKEQMVTDGILPIDNATDVLAACNVVGRRIPRPILEAQLNISLLPEDDMDESDSLAERLLNTLARRRGYMASHDRPNRARAGKELLKAYMDGRFVYVEPPPSFQPTPEALTISEEVVVQRPHGGEHAGGAEAEADDEEYEDWDSEDEQAWADLEEADDDRALSEGESIDSFMDTEREPPIFFIRARGRRNLFTRRELFNAPLNLERMAERKVERRRKRKQNQQLEPDMYTFVNKQGEVELRIDDDDGVVELVHAATGPLRPTLPKTKQKSKRQERRELKKMGAGPSNPSAKRVGIQDYGV